MRVLATLVLTGCIVAEELRAEPPIELSTPEIHRATLTCDPEGDTFTLFVRATSWTAGGAAVFTVDGKYIEKHQVPSIAVEPDGSGDELALVLPTVSDWRTQKPNTNTAFQCVEGVNVSFVLLDLDDKVSDCKEFGPNRSVFDDVSGVGRCN